jgi:hypothetical protein
LREHGFDVLEAANARDKPYERGQIVERIRHALLE